MRFNFLFILGLIFLIAGGWLVVTHWGETPHGGWKITQRPGGGTVYYMKGGGALITGGTFVFVGGILSLVGLAAARASRATAWILANGLSGQAMITNLTQTGVHMNKNPQIVMGLMVNVPGRTPYAVTHREFVPLMLLGRLSAGVPLLVKVDPANPQRIVIDWASTVFAADK